VTPGSTTHTRELFGPVLGVMCARSLDAAIDLVHQTGYGLTSGLHSLDDREQEHWSRSVRAGNLYLNRGTTGAIVLRQPFGGMARSAIGPGLKAGGPNYVVPLSHFRETGPPLGAEIPVERNVETLLGALRRHLASEEVERLRAAAGSYRLWMADEFGCEHDHFRLVGQDNLRRYRPVAQLRIRLDPADSAFEILARVLAARAARCRITLSSDPKASDTRVDWLHELTEDWAGAIEFVEESDADLATSIRERQTDRVRYAADARVPDVVRRAAARCGLYLASAPVLAEGRIELLHYLREQSLCADYHRYGNLGARADEERAPVG
jgi:RHH-type proline utilization regulon transcriptional repressor/proline dehydrogenase/delta 1-pyrroline-5-carboxylate dehydrogenase